MPPCDISVPYSSQAMSADCNRVQWFGAGCVLQCRRQGGFGGIFGLFSLPLPGQQRSIKQREALVSEMIFKAVGAVGAPIEYIVGDELVKSPGEGGPACAGMLLQGVECPSAKKYVTQDQQAPAIADNIQASRYSGVDYESLHGLMVTAQQANGNSCGQNTIG